MMEQRGIDVATLFGNLQEVIDISDKFLDTLQVEKKSILMFPYKIVRGVKKICN